MAEIDFEITEQEIERDNLQRIVSVLEAAVAASSPADRANLQRSLNNATGHLSAVEKKIKDAQVEREHQQQEHLAMAEAQAANETRLSAEEKRNFAGFLKEDFFTRGDFQRLDQFYEKSWERLSEHGKDEMSHRIWEGVRKGEYRFSELPPKVREKEAERVYGAITKQSSQAADVSKIPENDRQEFVRAFEAGKKEQAEKVLDRSSFKQNLFRGADSKLETSAPAKIISEHDQNGRQAKAQLDLTDIKLDDVQLVEASAPQKAAEIPTDKTASASKARMSPGS